MIDARRKLILEIVGDAARPRMTGALMPGRSDSIREPPYPSLQAQQDAGAAAAWFPALTTMAGLQANWDFLSDFQQRGTLALDALRAQAAQSPWGVASNGGILEEPRLRSMEEMYLPD